MPRILDPVLVQGHERANPVTCDIVEVSAPDATRILRRANDQFFTNSPTGPRVSESPAASTAADANGAMILAPTDTQIVARAVENTSVNFGSVVDPSTIISGVGWIMPITFGRLVLKKFTARINRLTLTPIDLELRIYRPKIARVFERDSSGLYTIPRRSITFIEVLPEPVVVRYASVTWATPGTATDVIFDLSRIQPQISAGPILDDPILNDVDSLNPHFIFQINPVNPPSGNHLQWMRDATTALDVATWGRFQNITWTRPASQSSNPLAWSVAKNSFCECFKLEIETYAPTSQIVYVIDVGKAPGPSSSGRIAFFRG